MLFGVIQYCSVNRIPLPQWAVDAMNSAFYRWHEHEVDSLDEAFGLPFPKRQPGRRASRRRVKALLLRFVNELHELNANHKSIDWDALATKLGSSKTVLQDLFYGEPWLRNSFPQISRKNAKIPG